MTKPANAPGGSAQDPGGKPEDQKDDPANSDPAPEPKPNTVAYDTYKKAVDEAKKAKAKVDEFEKEKRESDEAKLKKDGEWKILLEQREQELKETKEKLAKKDEMISDARKRSAFLEVLSGEVPKQYWSLMNLDEIAVDPETGIPDEASVKRAAEKFEKQYVDVIKKPSTSKLPNDAPKGGSGKISYTTWRALPDDEKAARMKDVDKSTM